jgi:uncharacterized membrane protein YjgN (DUF898 family)
MAQEVQIQGAEKPAKIRDVVAVPLLTIVTLGIYGVVWYYKINREMADYGRVNGQADELGDSPVTSVLAITLGALVIVPALVSLFRCFKRIQALQRIAGGSQPINGWIGVLALIVFSPILYGYMQSGLNSAWQAHLSRA